MRICIEKSTGKLIEMQSDATVGTLIRNALQYGYNEQDIEEREVTQGEYQAIIDVQPKPFQPPTIEERLISTESAILELMGVLNNV